MVKIGIIIQARVGSKRLPGKVLKELGPGATILGVLLSRIEALGKQFEICVATSDHHEDDLVESFCKNLKVNTYRGPMDDVALRFLNAAEGLRLDVIVRLTADNPFVDPVTIMNGLTSHFETGSDYTSTKVGSGYPVGSDVEIFNLDALRKVYANGLTRDEREHVTLALYASKSRFRTSGISRETDGLTCARLTVDTQQDFEVAKARFQMVADSGDWVSATWEQFASIPASDHEPCLPINFSQ